MQETRVQPLGGEDLLEKEMATPSSILAWKIPWTEEPGRLQSMGSLRVGTTEQLHSMSIALVLCTHTDLCPGFRTHHGNGTLLQYSCLENPMD